MWRSVHGQISKQLIIFISFAAAPQPNGDNDLTPKIFDLAKSVHWIVDTSTYTGVQHSVTAMPPRRRRLLPGGDDSDDELQTSVPPTNDIYRLRQLKRFAKSNWTNGQQFRSLFYFVLFNIPFTFEIIMSRKYPQLRFAYRYSPNTSIDIFAPVFVVILKIVLGKFLLTFLRFWKLSKEIFCSQWNA